MDINMRNKDILSLLKKPENPPKEDIFRELLLSCKEIFLQERQVVEIKNKRILIVGDIHGDLKSAIEALKKAKELDIDTVLFLGDYVDRGPKQIEALSFLLGHKILEPDKFVLLRGNHESPLTNLYYGFYEEVSGLYGLEVYKLAEETFSLMPYAALIDGDTIALHGGIAKGLSKVEQIEKIPKGDMGPKHPIAFQILWNDPDESIEWFDHNIRGPGIFRFGKSALVDFFSRNGLRRLFRAHQFFPEGFRVMFNGLLVSIFSCSYYGGSSSAAVLEKGEVRPIVLV
ncbi:MAG: serine/threonine protein phosphatase [Thermoproteota archaeon]|nr:MAG: serine/threonine protein phosphatase [Candidatus Korarchaeota archaeon]